MPISINLPSPYPRYACAIVDDVELDTMIFYQEVFYFKNKFVNL